MPPLLLYYVIYWYIFFHRQAGCSIVGLGMSCGLSESVFKLCMVAEVVFEQALVKMLRLQYYRCLC